MDLSLIFRNYPINEDSIEMDSSSDDLFGGTKTNTLKNQPHGGFPPIFPCNEQDEDDSEIKTDQEKRGYTTVNKNIVSIQNILEKRRKIVPFIPK